MVVSVTTQIAQAVNIPCGIVRIGRQAVLDIPARNFPICAMPAIPQAEIGNDQDGHIQLDIEICSLIIQLDCVQLVHALYAFVF